MKKLLQCLLFFICASGFAQTSSTYSVYLVGDAGEDTIPGKALLMLKEQLMNHPNSTVLFLGDNVYPSGLHVNDKKSILHLESQLQVLKSYTGSVFFIPGNHDWDAQKQKGMKCLSDQEKYVESYLKTKTTVANKEADTFLPDNGLPGPATVMLNDKLRLIIIDTQWFLHAFKKGKQGTTAQTKKMCYARLDSLLAYSKKNGEQVIVAAHHPMYTNGQHSKSRQPFRFLVNCTPFQLFGLLGVNRLYSQDIAQPKYKKMRKKMLSMFDQYDNITFVSGHDHNIQCFKEGQNRYVVSGSGSKLSQLSKRKKFDSVFQDDSKTGFVKLDYSLINYLSTTIYQVGVEAKKLEGF